jgi:hypothetical protein
MKIWVKSMKDLKVHFLDSCKSRILLEMPDLIFNFLMDFIEQLGLELTLSCRHCKSIVVKK